MKEETEKSNTGMLIALAIAVIMLVAFGYMLQQRNKAEAQLKDTQLAVEKFRNDQLNCEAQLIAAQQQSADQENRVELVYISPRAGCGQVCTDMKPLVEQAAEDIGFHFRAVMLPANVSAPGMYVLGKDTMSEIFPINNERVMNFVFCNRFNITERCVEPTVNLTQPRANNTAPAIAEIKANGSVVG